MKNLIKIIIILSPLFSMAGVGGGGVGPRPSSGTLEIKLTDSPMAKARGF